jgi:Tol biopolymer transport system component
LFDLQTGRWRTLYDAVAGFPTWSRDGRFIYFVAYFDDRAEVLRVAVRGGPPELVASLKDISPTGTWSEWFGLDPDDDPLYLRDKGTDEIYALTLERK